MNNSGEMCFFIISAGILLSGASVILLTETGYKA